MKNGKCHIYLVRHGESVANVENINQGHFDSPLTKHGQEQAQDIAKKLSSIDFASIHSSDLIRAKHTAEIIRGDNNITINTSPALRERSFGSLEGLPQSKYRKTIANGLEKFDSLTTEEKWLCRVHPAIETDSEVYERSYSYLQSILSGCDHENILIVSHRGPTRLLLAKLDYLPYESIDGKKALGNTGYVQLVYKNNTLSVVDVWNLSNR